jgi:DNA invertase Pin-like site-specific DNA recombinase
MAPSTAARRLLQRKYVTYYRVSTQDQGRSGFALAAQQATAKQYLAAHGGVELASYTEVESGKLDSRPKLEATLLRRRQPRATLLVAKLNRLSRNISLLFRMRDEGVKHTRRYSKYPNFLNSCLRFRVGR